MQTENIDSFNLIGISARTTNENEQASIDIPALWEKFMAGRFAEKIPGKIDNTIYCIYTDYEKDFTKPYTVILGCKVESTEAVPAYMVGKSIAGADYVKFVAKGNLLQGAVFHEWKRIWDTDISRAYTSDFEVYGEKSANPENGEVEIFIAVK